MSDHFDALETRAPAEREAALLAALPGQIAYAQQHAPAFAELLADVDPASVTSREALARLPVIRKHELLERQKAQRASDPFGGFSALRWGARMSRVFASPGPIYEPEAATRDYWRAGRALYAAGFRAGDLVHNAFSYHMTPGAFILESGALAVVCTVFPAGTGQTEQQLQAIAELRPDAYTGTPSFLRILLEKGAGSFHKALVSGEAFPPALRDWCAAQGVQGFQCYATADCGLIAYETQAHQGLLVDEGVIVEIVQPGSGTPVAAGEVGEVGEVVVTRLDPAYPLLRYATGDLSAELPGPSACGRTNRRLQGWLGRADQSAKVRGLFVHESQVQQLRARFDGVPMRWRIAGEMANDRFTVQMQTAPDAALAERVQAAVRELTQLRCEVEFVKELPLDGRLIEDIRPH
jgi:phenylacetate-CoA ligase